MTDDIEIVLRKIDDLNKKLELYYKRLYIENELSFVLNGKYILEEDLKNILEGNY